MSTEIFQSDYTGPKMSNPYAHLNPVQIYLALSLPLHHRYAPLLGWLSLLGSASGETEEEGT